MKTTVIKHTYKTRHPLAIAQQLALLPAKQINEHLRRLKIPIPKEKSHAVDRLASHLAINGTALISVIIS